MRQYIKVLRTIPDAQWTLIKVHSSAYSSYSTHPFLQLWNRVSKHLIIWRSIWHKDCPPESSFLLQYKRKGSRYREEWKKDAGVTSILWQIQRQGFDISASQFTNLKPFFFFNKLIARLWWKESGQSRQITPVTKSPITTTTKKNHSSLVWFYINSKVSRRSKSSQA